MKSSECLLKTYSEHRVCDWDLIIISSRDESQKCLIERQISDMKQNQRHIISDKFKFIVISDQKLLSLTEDDYKLGSGGSTILIFQYLSQQFGRHYFQSNKILLIHSGGDCIRLPHYSIRGKLFCNLPIDLDNKLWTGLDVKLALLSPFAKLISNGVFITASDDIVIYSYDELEFNGLSHFNAEDVICLGHPSSAEVAVNHGVYILNNRELDSIQTKSISLYNCLKVLQKPTLDELTKFNAFVRSDDKEFCITDSSFYLGAQVIIDKFLKIPIRDMKIEIDCYGHFLCPLGSEPVTKELNTRFSSPLNDILIGTQMKVLFIRESKFIHLGTISEYMDQMTDYNNKYLAKSLCFKTLEMHNSIKGTVVYSLINANSKIDNKSVVEFCNFSEIAVETDNNLIYNCWFEKSADILVSLIKFPANYLIYSVPVTINGEKCWCTFGCHFNSQLKSSLWTDKVFPVCQTPSQSLISTLNLINNNINQNMFPQSIKLSMSDVKEVKNIEFLIEFQNKLKSIS